MGKKAPAPPPPPDPAAVSAAQTASNVNTALSNAILQNPNVVSPYGTTTYSTTPGQTQTVDGREIPRYTQTTTLSPEQQKLYDQQTQIGSGLNDLALSQVGRLSGVLNNPLDLSGLNPIKTDFSGDRTAVENALFQRLQPQLDRQQSQLYDKLVNQGLRPGEPAWQQAMDDYNRSVNDLRLGVTGQGLQEQQGLFGMNQAAHQQQLQDLLTARNQPINEVTALMSGGQVTQPTVPAYTGAGIAPTDVAGNIYNSAALANQQYQTQLQNQGAATGGLFGLGSAALLGGLRYAPQIGAMFMSDRRLKADIVDLGIRLMNGAKLYAYRYVWGTARKVGVMADELLSIRPDAVMPVNGYLAVNYGAL